MKFSLLTPTLIFLTIYQWSFHYASAGTCTIRKYDADDIKRAVRECTAIRIDGIEVPAGETLTLTELRAGSNVIFSGTITWGYKEWEGPLISIAGVNIDITGAAGHLLDGRGSLWWDGKGTNGGKKKPKFFQASLIGSRIHDIKIKNSPGHVLSIHQCVDLTVRGVTIDNSAGDSGGALNTDAFDVASSSDVKISGCTIFNQGDCFAVSSSGNIKLFNNHCSGGHGISGGALKTDTFDVASSSDIKISGCTIFNKRDCLAVYSGGNIKFFNNYCSGGHGISIGPVGNRGFDMVSDVKVSDCEIINSDNGIRIRSVYGSVSDITYQNVSLSSIHKYGIVIEGGYEYGKEGITSGRAAIKDLEVKDIHGTVDSLGVNVYVFVEGASNWHFSDISVTGGIKTKTCKGIPSGAGISC